MRSSMLLAFVAPYLAIASPAPLPSKLGAFNVTGFSYKCTTSKAPCFWDFYVSDPHNFSNHPAIDQKLHCTGNTTETEFTPGSCTDPTNNKYTHINAYVGTTKKHGTKLNLQYDKVPKTEKQFFWYYFGNTTVSDSSTKAKDFVVPESVFAEST